MRLLGSKVLRREMESYRGLTCGAAPGVHACMVELLIAQGLERNSVVDFGAGSGALLQRLRDAGFTDLTAADVEGAEFALPGIPWCAVDLNDDYARSFERKFKVVCMSEVIEHIDSPRHVLKQARVLLEDDGLLVLSTPNIAFWEGRIKFLLTGDLWGFGESRYRGIRHISPLSPTQLRLMLQEIGFEVVALTSAGSFATPLRSAILSPIWAPMTALAGGEIRGESLVAIARKSAPDASLSSALLDWRTTFDRTLTEGADSTARTSGQSSLQ
jgi:SAM-dependent methyltransferase